MVPFSLWFIDYRIKRNAEYEPTREDSLDEARHPPQVFHGTDCCFVEVTSELGRCSEEMNLYPWDAGGRISED